jgi:tRNA(Ile)-lysidine synthase
VVLLAHHRRDQAETVMLQALRSAGPAGLSGMPRAIQRDGLWWCRPWLDRSSDAVEAYVRRHRLKYVDDASNRDPRYARSRLRVQAWPLLTEAFPHLETALVGVARRMQEADAALSELAQRDRQAGTVVQGALVVKAWTMLSPARRALQLRHWAREWSAAGMPESLLTRLQDELPAARTGHRWPAPGGELRLRRGGALHYVPLDSRMIQVPNTGG